MQAQRLVHRLVAVAVLLELLGAVADAHDDLPVLVGVVGDRHEPLELGHVLARPVLHRHQPRQGDRGAVRPAVHPGDLQAQFLVLQHRRPLVGTQPLQHALGTVLVFQQGDAVALRQQAERQYPLHHVDDAVVLVQ
ncbi:hypothetical protein D3C78_1128570 [compost metagenome]